MLHASFRLPRYRDSRILRAAAAPLVLLLLGAASSSGQVLVSDPFISPSTGWVDAEFATPRAANWRLSLHNPTLMDTNNANPPTSGAVENSGVYESDVLVKETFLAPANYELSAKMYSNDDDIIGLVWNYQNPDNYFRVGIRQQAAGSFGGTQGLSVQKIVNGTLTQLVPSVVGPGVESPITQEMIDNRTPFDLRVAVNGSNYEIFFNNTSVASGTDSDLAANRKIGFQSWAQQSDAAAVTPFWGTEIETVSVKQGATTLYSEDFAARTHDWRPLVMTNGAGVPITDTGSKEALGNFGQDVNDPWILQQSNGFLNATFSNTDFIGPAVVIDEPGSSAFTNYQMQTRIGTSDNDGIGVLVRVQDDNNFYRVTFANEAADAAGVTRAPRGMSVQKVRNGAWTELFRDDPENPLFVYTPSPGGSTPASDSFTPFDLSVGAVGNSLKIQVRDHEGNVINYPLITDVNDPILAGTVGLHTWGTDHVYYSAYGGGDSPLVTTLTAFAEVDATINRSTGNLTITNNGSTPLDISGITIGSEGGLNPANWLSVTNNYDAPPQNGSVDPDDPWTILSSTSTELSEAEQSGGDGGTLSVGQSVNLGNVWVKSRIEDVTVDLQLVGGGSATAAVAYSGGPGGGSFARSDLNADGVINAADWPLFYPNALADLSSMTMVQQALAGDLDGDGDNDVNDFAIFKADFDSANGAGAFQAMISAVPEPGSLAMLLLGGIGALVVRGRRSRTLLAAGVCAAALVSAGTASAAPLDFTTMIPENYTPAATFPTPVWEITPTTATLNNNADATVLYTTESASNKRFIGQVTPGTDDDVIGFVLGFQAGNAQLGSTADYLLIDWKGITQNFNFADADPFNFFHDQTPASDMPVGLALSRVTNSPTADELWSHSDSDLNTLGGVQQLARGATLGSTPYNRSNGSHVFDIRYSSTNVTVLVDGVEQFNLDGTFPDGAFGLYSAWQGPPATFSNFEVVDTSFGLTATVDRSNGNIILSNEGSGPVEFDYYQITSEGSSLNPAGWNSLSDQNFQPVGAGNGQSWDEAGGSDASAIGELYLQSSSSLTGGASVDLGNAYNNVINAEDLVLSFRLPSGLVIQGNVDYIGTAPVGLPGDFNGNGTVENADLTLLLNNWGAAVPPVPAGWVGDQPVAPAIDNGELTALLNNWGNTAGAAASVSSVPEPSTLVFLIAGSIGFSAVSRRRNR